MANKRNRVVNNGNILFDAETNANETPITSTENLKEKSFLSGLGRGERIAAIGVCLLLVVGALGASGFGEKIISTFGSRNSIQKANQSSQVAQNSSMLSKLNPFAPAAVVVATPQLSKEYIYAGSRMLAVEDANASALPPADLAVWRPSSGTWYVLNSSNQQWTSQSWGLSGDIPVPGDYDGDGKTDFSVFRPSNNYWYISYSSTTGGYISYPFGSSNLDKTAQADYDGDGKTDAAVYRASAGYWYIVHSSDQLTYSIQFGNSSDAPAPGDFDGDGKADLSVWRDSAATFYVFRSSDGALQSQALGQTGDKPVVADYDGDGKADFAVRHGADWVIKPSAGGATQTVTWQSSGDQEVPNDYDGDGKCDIAVWRDSTGVWYIRNSHDLSTRTVQWGQTGDTPVPAFYRR
jgi:hypothetical protein